MHKPPSLYARRSPSHSVDLCSRCSPLIQASPGIGPGPASALNHPATTNWNHMGDPTTTSTPSTTLSPWARLAIRFRKSHTNTSGAASVGATTSNRQASTSNHQGLTATAPKHLIMLANGLFGHQENWNTIVKQLRKKLDADQVLIHCSNVNRRTDTYDGIDVCGWRLADEISSVVKQYPSLERISVIGHSMGGLLLRFAIGVSYDPATGKVAGLQPCHFVTLATPHLGCDAEGLSQVPFIGWLGVVQPLQRLLNAISVPTAGVLFRRTGRQFFMADEPDSGKATGVAGLPLLARMTQDTPEKDEYFWSALCSFASRTSYANTGRDHLVGWANSSLRFVHQLPELPASAAGAKGVVLEDALMAAFDVRYKSQVEPQAATSAADLPVGSTDPSSTSGSSSPRHSLSGRSVPGQPQRRQLATQAAPSSQPSGGSGTVAAAGGAKLGSSSGGGTGGTGAAATGDAKLGSGTGVAATGGVKLNDRGAMVEEMLQRLQSLSWRRIDVSFRGALLPFAHNHIQVTRRWLNFEGESVAIHLAEQMVALDATWAEAFSPVGHPEQSVVPIGAAPRQSEGSAGGQQSTPLFTPLSPAKLDALPLGTAPIGPSVLIPPPPVTKLGATPLGPAASLNAPLAATASGAPLRSVPPSALGAPGTVGAATALGAAPLGAQPTTRPNGVLGAVLPRVVAPGGLLPDAWQAGVADGAARGEVGPNTTAAVLDGGSPQQGDTMRAALERGLPGQGTGVGAAPDRGSPQQGDTTTGAFDRASLGAKEVGLGRGSHRSNDDGVFERGSQRSDGGLGLRTVVLLEAVDDTGAVISAAGMEEEGQQDAHPQVVVEGRTVKQ